MTGMIQTGENRLRRVGRLTGAKVEMKKGGIAVVDGLTLVALLRPKELRRVSRGSGMRCRG